MKKMLIVGAAILMMAAAGYAGQPGCGKGMPGGCADCGKPKAAGANDPWRKFQAETIDLRQEMMMKRFELQRENLKPAPDSAREALLQQEIDGLRDRIHQIKEKNGIACDKRDGECGSCSDTCCKKGKKGCNGKHCRGN